MVDIQSPDSNTTAILKEVWEETEWTVSASEDMGKEEYQKNISADEEYVNWNLEEKSYVLCCKYMCVTTGWHIVQKGTLGLR